MKDAGEQTWGELAVASRHVLEEMVRGQRRGRRPLAGSIPSRPQAGPSVVTTRSRLRTDRGEIDLIEDGKVIAAVSDQNLGPDQFGFSGSNRLIVDEAASHSGPASQARFIEAAARSGHAVVVPGVSGLVRSLLSTELDEVLAESVDEVGESESYRRSLWRAAQTERANGVEVVLAVRVKSEDEVRAAFVAARGRHRTSRVVIVCPADSVDGLLDVARRVWSCPVVPARSSVEIKSAIAAGYDVPVVVLDGACDYPRGFVEDLVLAWLSGGRADMVAACDRVFLEDVGIVALWSGSQSSGRIVGVFSQETAASACGLVSYEEACLIAGRLPNAADYPTFTESASWRVLVQEDRAQGVRALVSGADRESLVGGRAKVSSSSWFDCQSAATGSLL